MPKKKKHPTAKQLKNLESRGWKKSDSGAFWQSPYDNYYYSPQMAVVREARKA